MSKFHYHVIVGDQAIDIVGKTSAHKDNSDVYKAGRLYGNVSVRIGEQDQRLIVSYKELKELNDTFSADSHDNEAISETLNAAFGVLIKRTNIEGLDVRLASSADNFSLACNIL